MYSCNVGLTTIKNSMKKNYLCFDYFVLLYYLFIDWDRDQDQDRYTDMWIYRCLQMGLRG